MHKVLHRGLAIVVTGMMLLAGCLWLLNTTQAANRGSSSPFSSLGATQKCILVEDFKHENEHPPWWNYCGGSEYCWKHNAGSISCSVQTTSDDGYLEMQYNVITPTTYALFTSELTPTCRNLAAFDAVWVAVMGENGSESIYVEFADCGFSQFPKQVIGGHLAQGIITSDYSAVAIPLEEFSEITDWSCINRVNILAHNQIASGQGKIYVDEIRILPARVLVDDFNDRRPENELGGESYTWLYSGTIVYDYPDGVLKLDYDVVTPTAAATYMTKLRYTNLLSQKDALFFKIRGDQGSEEITALFEDCDPSGHYPKVKVSDYLVGGITIDWREVSIPLAAFTDDMDWTCVKYIGFYVSADPCFNSGQGTVYIDDVILAPTSWPIPLIVDHFDDCNDCNALIGEWNCHTSGTATIDCAPDPDLEHRYGNHGCGYRITYDVKGTSAAWVYSDLRGVDVTDYTHLRFFLKGAAGGEAFHLYLGDRNGIDRYYENIVADNQWQEWKIPLDYFSPPVNLTNLSGLKIAFEWKDMAGEVYLDDISFMRPYTTFLPIVMKGYCVCGPDNYEPNDSCDQAYGPLTSGQTYQSYISCCDVATYKKSDYFYIDINTTNTIHIYLTDIPAGTDYDLYLYRNPGDDPDNPLCKSEGDGSSETISCSPPATGRYYIRVYGRTGYSASPYSLRVTYD